MTATAGAHRVATVIHKSPAPVQHNDDRHRHRLAAICFELTVDLDSPRVSAYIMGVHTHIRKKNHEDQLRGMASTGTSRTS